MSLEYFSKRTGSPLLQKMLNKYEKAGFGPLQEPFIKKTQVEPT